MGVVAASDRGHEHTGAFRRGRGQPGELGEHLPRDGIRAATVGVHSENGDIFIYRQTPPVHLIQIGPGQQRPELIPPDPRHSLVVTHAQIHDPGVAQHRACPLILDSSATQAGCGNEGNAIAASDLDRGCDATAAAVIRRMEG